MKQIILLILTILFSFGKGYSQYSITLDSSFNFGDKERFLKQSTGLKGYVVAAQVNKRGNYLIAGNGIEINQVSIFSGSVIEVTPQGVLVNAFDQVIPNYKGNQTVTGIADMFVDKATENIYLLADGPFKGVKTPDGEETGVIVLDKNLNEIRRISVPNGLSPNFDFASISSGKKFVYSELTNELFIISSLDVNENYQAIFKVTGNAIIPIPYHLDYYLDWKLSVAVIGNKMFSISRRVDDLYYLGKKKLCVSVIGQLPDTSSLDDRLKWQGVDRLYQYSENHTLVQGWLNGVKKYALINTDLEIDTTSLVIRNLKNKLDYSFTAGERVFLWNYIKYHPDSTFAFNDNFWEMDIDGSNLRPSDINRYPDTYYRYFRQEYNQLTNIKGTNNFLISIRSNIYIVRNNKIDHEFNRRLGPDYGQILDIQPTLNNKFFVGGDFDFYNKYRCDGLVRINIDGSLDTTFRFYFTDLPYVKNVSRLDNFEMKPDVISPLKNGDIIVGFTRTPYNSRTLKTTYRLKSNGTLDTSFKLDSIPLFRFNKVKEIGSDKYLVYRAENFDDDITLSLPPTILDINVTNTSGKTIRQLLVNKESPNKLFSLLKVKVLDSTSYLLVLLRRNKVDRYNFDAELFIYKVDISETTLNGKQPLYYKQLTTRTYFDFNNEDNWNIKISDKFNKEHFTIIYFDGDGKVVNTISTKEPLLIYYPQIKIADSVRLSLTNSYNRTSYEWFYAHNERGERFPIESTDFNGLVTEDKDSYRYYLDNGIRIQRINDSLFWFFADRMIIGTNFMEGGGSISGFFRVKVKGTKIESNPDNLKIRIYPNPTSSISNIEMPFYFEDGLSGNVIITDMTGKQMFKSPFSLLKYEFLRVNLSDYNSGIYFIRIETNGRMYYAKMVKR